MTRRRAPARQRGQSMVEYTIVTALGVMVLLGPGADVIRFTLRSIQDNYQGYSYAMSLSSWPEFRIRPPTPLGGAALDTTAVNLGNYGSGQVPPRPAAPDVQFNDLSSLAYRNFLVAQGVSEERATELAGPSLDDVLEYLWSFFSGAVPEIPGMDGNFPVDIPMPTSPGDIIGELSPFSFL